MKKTKNFIKKFLKDKTVVLGLSFGPDSMCLLSLLLEENINVVCAYVNHNIRDDAKKEQSLVEKYCTKNNIKLEKTILEKDTKGEDYYRILRQNFFKQTALKYKTDIILTAHHADDLMETILMRITRGSNLAGYAGFKLVNKIEDFYFMKPLIFYTKDEILHFNDINNIPYIIDKTNLTNKYRRNRFRNRVLPVIKSENKYVHEKFLDYSRELYKADEYIQGIINKIKGNMFKNNVLDLKEYNLLDNYIKERLLQSIFNDIYGDDIILINKKHLKKVGYLIENNDTFKYSLPKGFTVLKEYDKLLFDKFYIRPESDYKILLDRDVKLNNGIIKFVTKENSKSNYVIRLNKKDLKLPLYIRTRKVQDKIKVKNSSYFKKIKKIFIDKKVPKRLRDDYPIVVDSDDRIIWIPGIIKSEFDVDKDKKYDIILKYEGKENIHEEEKQ